jgi:hypothetical protein
VYFCTSFLHGAIVVFDCKSSVIQSSMGRELIPIQNLVQVLNGKQTKTVELSSYTAETLLAQLEVAELQAA